MANMTAIATKTRLRLIHLQHWLAQCHHELFDAYHPEKHYMRGPGPKWREKHGGTEH